MQGDNNDDKGGAGGFMTKTGKPVMQVTVRASGEAVAAERTAEPRPAGLNICGGKCPVAADTGADPAFTAS